MTAPVIAVAVSPRAWADRLHRFVADHGGARVRARVLDGRQALDEPYTVLVVDDLTSFLTPRLVADLHARGRRVLGVYDPDEEQGRVRLARVGVDGVLAATTPPEELLDVVQELAAVAAPLEAAPSRQPDGAPPGQRAAVPAGAGAGPNEPAGTVVAIGAPPGGCGATEVTVALATVAGGAAVVVDADGAAPSVAQRLQLGLHPNLRTAVDTVQHWSGALTETLQHPRRGGFSVLAGAAAVPEQLRGSEVADVVAELSRTHRTVLVDLGHVDGPARQGPLGELLARADRVLGVGAPSPVGLTRLLGWLADTRAATDAPLAVAFNRVPPGAFVRAELETELVRTVPAAPVVFLPEDHRVRRAAWAGWPVAGGPFVRAIRQLAADLVPEGAPAPTFHAREPAPSRL